MTLARFGDIRMADRLFKRWSFRTTLAVSCVIVTRHALAYGYDESHPVTLPPSETGWVVSAYSVYDDNVTRTDSDVLSDESLGLTASDGLSLPLSPYVRVLIEGSAGLERFDHWVGLGHLDLGARAELQYRPSAAFYAPTFSLSAHITGLDYETRIRSGERSVAELSVIQPVTDQVTAFAAVSHEERRAENSTFDGHTDGARLHLDDALSDVTTLYAGVEHRYGDAVSTSFPDPDNRALSLSRTPDPAFGDTGRITYRIKGATNFATLGLNRALGEFQSIDLSWRKAVLKPARALTYFGATEAKYTDNQVTLSYLVRF